MTTRLKCIGIAKEIAKIRDRYICQKCGTTRANAQIQGSHVFPVTFGNVAADPINIRALCASCHEWARDSWHNHPLGQWDWFDEKFPGLYEEIKSKAYPIKPIKKYEWEEKLVQLKQQLKEVKNGNS